VDAPIGKFTVPEGVVGPLSSQAMEKYLLTNAVNLLKL
jgi:hypothetical protein